MSEAISTPRALAKLVGLDGSDEQLAEAGARLAISQIDKLRNALKQAERCAQHIIATGKERHDDRAVWARVARAADKLLDGMA